MKDTTSIDKLAIQVQQTLFEYFYFHNKMHLEATFSSPRFCIAQPRRTDCLPKTSPLSSPDSTGSKNATKLGTSHKIHKSRVRLSEGEVRPVL